MINVQEIRRNVINVVKNYSDAQVKVRKATSNEPWGPSATLMSEIADLTHNVVAFSEIMHIIWKRLNDHGKNWRHVYKALVLLEYLIKTGSEKVAQQCRDNLFAIQTLKDFQHFEESKDQGMSIREKSKLLVNLLKDDEKLKVERARALKAKERFSQSMSCMGSSSDGAGPSEAGFKSSSSYPESLSQNEASSSRSVNSEIENARPQTAGEEKLQLELALAMSKEEAEQEERLRKNDDLRLKLALQESEKNASKKTEPRSAVDDLLSLSSTPGGSAKMPAASAVSCDPWAPSTSGIVTSAPVAASLLPSPPNKNKSNNSQQHPNHNDPWSGPSNFVSNDQQKSFDDPWSASAISNNDPWGLNDPTPEPQTVANNDPWNLDSTGSMSGGVEKKPNDFGALGESLMMKAQPAGNSNLIRRTPESFLGPNSNLVNLDALVSSNKVQTCSSPNNPFAAAVPPSASNPFQANKPSQPTINELRAQNNSLGGGISGGVSPVISHTTNLAMGSLFNSSSSSSTMAASVPPFAAPVYPTLPAFSNGGSAWDSFPGPSSAFSTTAAATSPSQPNNPFAM